MPSNPDVRTAMHQLAETLNAPSTLPESLLVLTQGAVDAIPGADYASISVRHADGRLETLAATAPLVDALDAEQYKLREGPCYQAATDESFLVTFDLEGDDRWPNYGPVAAQAGFHAQLAVVLTVNNTGRRSTLNVYSSRPQEFDHESIQTAELFASHASVAMGFVHTVENLGTAITNRQMIGQAVGIIMERYQLTESRAFGFLVRVSQTSNTKLNAVAADIVTSLSNRNHSPSPSSSSNTAPPGVQVDGVDLPVTPVTPVVPTA